ncbi:MAG TPA: energy transducer TonB [Terriglobia bacterium]|nr:energy transducer TonB [Terriglobia bacterium]
MAGMETIDDIRAALGATTKPRNGGQPGDHGNGKPPEDKRSGKQRPKPRFPAEFVLFSPESIDLTRGRFPGRGLLYSFLFHEIAVFLLLLSPSYVIQRTKEYRPVNNEPLFIDAEVLKEYLPSVGGGQESSPEGETKGEEDKKGDAAPASEGQSGLTYPGPQPIVSRPPVPDNTVQTIRQPDLVSPPVIKVPVMLPNQVQIAAPKAPELKGTSHALEIPVSVPPAPPPPPEVKPKLVLPPPKPELAALPTASVKDLAQSTPKLSAPKPPPPKVLPSSGDQMRNLAVLSPVLNKPTEVAEIPMGERHGSFAIGPPALKGKSSEPGAGTGNHPGAGAAATASAATGAGTGGATATGHGAGAGSSLVAGNGAGTGSATGAGLGRAGTGQGAGGSGTGKGSGVGAGIGPGHGPFPGLAIEGGVGAGGSIPRSGMHMNFGPDKSYNYGMTVEAEGKSGGGLRDFGIFRDEPVYTVYVDVPEPKSPMAPWTLEYAVLDPSSSSTVVNLKKVAAAPEQQIIAPFPTTKEDPKLPWDVVKQYPGHMLVVYAEISPEGKLRKIHILDSPDIELSQLVLQALAKWEFKPAIVNGKPVAVKTLFGVPLAPPEKAVDHAPVAPVDHKPVPPVEHHAPAPPPLKHAPAPAPLAHASAPAPLKHVAPPPPLQHAPAPPPLKHAPAPPPLSHQSSKNEVRTVDIK